MRLYLKKTHHTHTHTHTHTKGLVEWLKRKKISLGEDVARLAPVHCWWERKWYNHYENSLAGPQNIKNRITV
jgi:hypothetical protein